MDTTQETESIRSLVRDIEAQNVVLPEFQRDFVWEVGKTHDLFDSVIKDIFIGSIIYGIPSFEITVREIDKRPRKGKGSRAKLRLTSFNKKEIEARSAKGTFRLVLDGQQRITAIYRAIKGIDSVWFVAKHGSEIGTVDFDKATCEQLLYQFSGQEDPERLSIRISDVSDMMEDNYFEAEIRQKFFKDLKAVQNLSEQESTEWFRRYLTLSRKLQDVFKADKLLSYYLLNTTTEKFSLFFERSNSKGIQLSFTDILAAKLYDGFNLRNAVEEFQEKYHSYEFNREVVVRAIAFIVSNGKQIDRNYILNTLTAKDFNQNWARVVELYRKSIDFLFENHFIISQPWMPYDNMLIPLMFFLDGIGGDFSQMSEEQHKIVRAWYWCSIFSERYSGSTNEITTLDANVLSGVAMGNHSFDRSYTARFKIQVDEAAEILLINKKGSVLYSGLLNLINFNAGGLTDWSNNSRLSLNSKLEDHHIFPKDYLKFRIDDNEDAGEMADSVANRTLLPKITNIKVSNKKPSTYLTELKAKNSAIESTLTRHLIPELTSDGLYDESYEEFLVERSNLIFSAVTEHVLKSKDFLASRSTLQEKDSGTT